MTSKSKVLIGVCAFAILVIVVILIIKRPGTATPVVVQVMPATPDAPAQVVVMEPETLEPLMATSPEPLPPVPAATEAASAQTVESHRAELLRGTALARARVSAPTTSALIMNSALTGRESGRQNVGETAMMDRLNATSTNEPAPW